MAFEKENTHRKIESMALVLAAIFAFACAAYFSRFELNVFLLWVLAPYAVYFLMSKYVLAPKATSTLAHCVVAVFVLAFTVFFYVDGLFIHTSSTSPLLFIWIPIYLLVGGSILLWVWLLIGKIARAVR